MRTPAPPLRRRRLGLFATAAAVLLSPGLALASDYVLTFTGDFSDTYSDSYQFDGLIHRSDVLPPLFSVERLDGGTFSASLILREADTVDDFGSTAYYTFGPALDLSFTLFDADGLVVHTGRAPISEASVSNNATRPGPRDDVGFSADDLTDLTGLTPPPELYGPNQVYTASGFLSFESFFRAGGGPIGDTSIPLDADTYLGFDDRYFDLVLEVFNEASDGSGAFIGVYTELSYEINGVTIGPATAAVPEPSAMLLVAIAAPAVVLAARRRRGRYAG